MSIVPERVHWIEYLHVRHSTCDSRIGTKPWQRRGNLEVDRRGQVEAVERITFGL